MPIQPEDIEHRFAYHKPADDSVAIRHENVRFVCREAAKAILSMVPAGREQSLAITKLEEAMMWANAASAREQPMDLTTAPDTSVAITAKGP